MARSILIYSMPENTKEFLVVESGKHDLGIIEYDDSDLRTKISMLLKGEDGGKIEYAEEGVDIDLLMINKFNNQVSSRLLGDIQRENIYIPNRCMITEHNICWPLEQPLLENKEEHEAMTIYKELASLRSQAIQSYKESDDDKLHKTITEVTEYMQPKGFGKDELIRGFDHLKPAIERIS